MSTPFEQENIERTLKAAICSGEEVELWANVTSNNSLRFHTSEQAAYRAAPDPKTHKAIAVRVVVCQ